MTVIQEVHDLKALAEGVAKKERSGSKLSRFVRSVAKAMGQIVAESGPLSQTLYVDGTSTNTALPRDGSIARPYLTITAALAAVTGTGATILVGPGTYAENVVIPPTRNRIVIRGAGATETIISGTGGAGTRVIAAGPTSAIDGLTIADLGISGAGAGTIGIFVDASGALTSYAVKGVRLENLVISSPGNAVSLFYVNFVSLFNVVEQGAGTGIGFVNVGGGTASGCTFNETVVSYDFSGGVPQPSGGRGTIKFKGSYETIGTFAISDMASVQVDRSCKCRSIDASALRASAAGAPIIRHAGQQGTNVTFPGIFALDLPDPALVAGEFNFDGSILWAPSVAITHNQAGAAGTQNVSLRGCLLENALGVVAMNAAAGCVIALDYRGSRSKVDVPYTMAGANAANITVDRDKVVKLNVTIPAGATPFSLGTGGTAPYAVEPKFPAGANYAVTYGLRAAIPAGQANDMPATTAVSATAFTTQSTAGTAADITFTRATN